MEDQGMIILDRDGVINVDRPDYVKSLDEWALIPGSLEAIANLCHAGYRVCVATNQQGIAKGLYSVNTLNQLHGQLVNDLNQYGGRIEAFFFCPHLADAGCSCRKPNPGMYLEIADRFNVDLSTVYVVGDAIRDLQAAVACGAQPALVRTGKGVQTEALLTEGAVEKGLLKARVFKDLKDFSQFIINK